jgi:4'-phosphopantetheinyl transferase
MLVTWNNSQSLELERTEGLVRVHFAAVHRTRFVELWERRAEFLGTEERSYLEHLEAPRRRESYLMGRYAAKVCVAGFLGFEQLAEIAIQRGVFEQPVVCCPVPDAPDVTLSHSDEIAVALAFPRGHPMGIDIERIDLGRAATMRSQAGSSELAWIESGGGAEVQAARSAAGWTAKEALSKALRCGLMTPLETLSVKEIRAETEQDWEEIFENFAQYKALSSIREGFALSIVLPKRSNFKAPRFPGDLIQ